MVALPPLFLFATMVCLWALFDFVVYAALRALEKPCGYGLRVLGSLSLVILWLGFSIVTLLKGSDADWNWSLSRCWEFVFVGGSVFLALLGFGGVSVRFATQKQLSWWHSVLFFSFYVLLSQSILIYFLNTHPPFFIVTVTSFSKILSSLGVSSSINDNFVDPLAVLLVTISPLIAPIFELLLRSFSRAYRQNKVGSFT